MSTWISLSCKEGRLERVCVLRAPERPCGSVIPSRGNLLPSKRQARLNRVDPLREACVASCSGATLPRRDPGSTDVREDRWLDDDFCLGRGPGSTEKPLVFGFALSFSWRSAKLGGNLLPPGVSVASLFDEACHISSGKVHGKCLWLVNPCKHVGSHQSRWSFLANISSLCLDATLKTNLFPLLSSPLHQWGDSLRKHKPGGF